MSTDHEADVTNEPRGGHHVDSVQHKTGSHALWQENCRLRKLLREVIELRNQLGKTVAVVEYAPIWNALNELGTRVRKELGDG